MGFLLKVKRAKFVLDETRKWMWKVLIHMIIVFFCYYLIVSFFVNSLSMELKKLWIVMLLGPIEEKLIQHLLRWFGHVQRRPPEAPVRNGVLELVDNVKRGRGRPKLTWVESVKRDLKDWNISKEIALDRSAWRLAINVPEP